MNAYTRGYVITHNIISTAVKVKSKPKQLGNVVSQFLSGSLQAVKNFRTDQKVINYDH